MDYKILGKAVINRTKPNEQDIIHSSKTGFMQG